MYNHLRRHALPTTLRLLVPPTQEPVSLQRVKAALRLTGTVEDALLVGWIASARQIFEDQTGRQILSATWQYGMDSTPRNPVIELPRPPLLDVLAVNYLDGDGVTQTLDPDSYHLDTAGTGSPSVVLDPFVGPGRIRLVAGASWPIVTPQPNAITIQYVAGYGSALADVPDIIKSALYDLTRQFWLRPDIEDLPQTTQMVLRMLRQSATPTLAPPVSHWLSDLQDRYTTWL